jgi:hypothetical protein
MIHSFYYISYKLQTSTDWIDLIERNANPYGAFVDSCLLPQAYRSTLCLMDGLLIALAVSIRVEGGRIVRVRSTTAEPITINITNKNQ